MDLGELITQHFINPIISPESQGYNLVNTITYIILLVIACAIIYKFLNKKIDFNKNFFISMLPYILFGVSMRVIMHQIEAGLLVINGIAKTANPLEFGFWFFTPGIWILTFTLVVIGLLIGKIWKNPNLKHTTYFGIIVAIIPFVFNLIHFNNLVWFLLTAIIITVVTYVVCFLVNKFTKYKILNDPMNKFIVAGQAIDGIASAIAIAFFNFSEQHVVSNFVIGIHPALFSLIKIVLAVLICWSLDDYLKDKPKHKNLIGFIKVIIAILGFATGLASLFKLGII